MQKLGHDGVNNRFWLALKAQYFQALGRALGHGERSAGGAAPSGPDYGSSTNTSRPDASLREVGDFR